MTANYVLREGGEVVVYLHDENAYTGIEGVLVARGFGGVTIRVNAPNGDTRERFIPHARIECVEGASEPTGPVGYSL
jgi:hypothetical protein